VIIVWGNDERGDKLAILDMGYTGLRKIISGGQVGVDQGALISATAWPIATGGWAPKNYRTARGNSPHLAQYGLKEHTSEDYRARTEANIREANGTLVIASNFASAGTALTLALCHKLGVPTMRVKLPTKGPASPPTIAEWIIKNEIEVLNVAGNRDERGTEYHCNAATAFMDQVFVELSVYGMIVSSNILI
jgi:hypothetical protein